MRAKRRKTSIIIIAILLITGFANRAEALIPLPSNDIKSAFDNLQVCMNQVQEIQAQATEIQNIIQEIQNGGFGVAVGDLLGMVVNGEFDRFGNRLTNIKSLTEQSVNDVQMSLEEKRLAKEYRKQGMSKEEARKLAAEKVAEMKAAKVEQRINKERDRAEKKAKRQNSSVKKSYNWLEDNRSTTETIRTGAYAIQNAN